MTAVLERPLLQIGLVLLRHVFGRAAIRSRGHNHVCTYRCGRRAVWGVFAERRVFLIARGSHINAIDKDVDGIAAADAHLADGRRVHHSSV